MKSTKYSAPPGVAFSIGPQMSECISWPEYIARLRPTGKGDRWCLPYWQPVHGSDGMSLLAKSSPFTTPLDAILMFVFGLMCASLRCHVAKPGDIDDAKASDCWSPWCERGRTSSR